ESSERPLVLAGQGVQAGEASGLLRELVEKAQLPVACTLLGLGAFPASHPLCVGMMGMHGEAWVNKAIQEADLLIAVGMRFDDRVTGNLRTYAVNARKIHIEIDPSEINKNVKVDVPLCGEAAPILADLIPRVHNHDRRAWLDHLHEMSHDTKARDIVAQPHAVEALHAAHVMHDLWQETEGKALVVTDVGQHQMWEAQYYKHEQTRQLITSGGLGTMGFALPAGLGARFARPNDDVWVIAGDGGFQMTACELSTCAQEGVKLNVAIINNGYLGMVRQWQEFFYSGRYVATPIRSPDFVKLAEAHGLTGLRATTRAEAREAMKRARSLPGTVVIVFRVEPEDSVYPMVPANADLRDMIRRPAPKFVED
ncbi:MAG: thiamine pyrophosphate-dependent enzyme, partial [Myxococcales bacterium]